MKGILPFLLLILPIYVWTQNTECIESTPFCTAINYCYPAGTGGVAQPGPYYGCLLEQPNPVWFHLKVDNPGDIIITMQSIPDLDIDFICWGPFDDPAEPCVSDLNVEKVVSCSYSLSGSETCLIPEGLNGEYYIFLITNYSDENCDILFSQSGGCGTTDCSIVASLASTNSPVCNEDTLKLFVENMENATYLWEGPNGFCSTLQNPIIVEATPENSGTYLCTVTYGIENTIEITHAEVLEIPGVTLSGDTAICSGSQAALHFNLTGKLPITIEYSNEFNSYTIDCYSSDTIVYVAPSQSSTYTVNAVYNSFCFNDEQPVPVEVVVNENVEVINVETICNDENTYYTVNFEITGGDPLSYNITPFTGVMSPGPPYIFASDPIPAETPYNFTIEDDAGCDPVIINGIQSCLCSASAYISGDYTICRDEDAILEIELTGNPPWNITYTANGADPQNIMIEESPYNLIVSPDVSTSYGLIYVEDQNCIGTAGGSANIAVNVSPSADFEYYLSCENNSVNFIDRSFVPYGSIKSWLWDFGDGATSNLQNPVHNYYEPGSYTVSLSVESYIGCGHAIFYDITIYPEMTVNAGDDMVIPYSSSAILSGIVTGGSDDFSIRWDPVDKVTNPFNLSTNTKELLESQLFILQSSDNETGCSQYDEVAVSVVGGPLSVSATVADPAICKGSCTQLIAIPEGGSGEYTYLWTSDPPGFVSELSNPVVTPGQTTTYFVEVSDGYSAVTEEEVVEIYPAPEAFAGNAQEVAYGAATHLTGNATGGTQPYSFCWSPAEMLIDHLTQNPFTKSITSSTVFQLVVTDAFGCTHTNEVCVDVIGGPLQATIETTVQNSICSYDTIELRAIVEGGTNQYLYRWFDGTGITLSTSPNIYVIPEDDAWYHIEISDGYDSILLSYEILVDPAPFITLIPEGYLETGKDTIEVCIYDTLNIEPLLDAYEYEWFDEYTESSREIFTTGIGWDTQTIWITTMDPVTGCTSTDSLTVIFDFAECTGLNDLSAHQDIVFYPNPTSGIIYFEIGNLPENAYLSVMDMTGRAVMEQKTISNSLFKGIIDMFHLQKGFYLITVTGENYQSINKIIIQ